MTEYSKTIPYRWLDKAPFTVRTQFHRLQEDLGKLAPSGLTNLEERLAIAFEIRTIHRGYNPAYPFQCVTTFCEGLKEPLHKDPQ